MAPALVHFLVGASLVLLLATPIALRYELSPGWPLWLVLVGGLWGLGPDLHNVAPVFETTLRAFHESPWADLFAGHYTLDRPAVRVRHVASVFGAIVVFLGAVSAFTAANRLRAGTTVAETRLPQFAVLSLAVLALLGLVAATSGGLAAVVAWGIEHVARL